MNDIRKKIIAAGVKNLRAYGYPSVTADNILTDHIYKGFFRSMLSDNKGKAGDAVDRVLDELLKEAQ